MSLAAWTITTNPVDTTWGLGEYRVMYEGTGDQHFSYEDSGAVITYLVQYQYYPQFLDDLMGYSYFDGSALHRVLPEQHPDLYNFWAMDADVKKSGQCVQLGTAIFDKAIIATQYRPADYAVLDDLSVTAEWQRYTTITFGYSVDYLTINGQMKFVTSGQVLQAQPGMVVATTEMTTMWHQVPAQPTSPFSPPTKTAIQNCLGKVNDATFMGYPAGTMLFTSPNCRMATPRLTPGSITPYQWEVGYNFQIKDNGAGLSGARAGQNYILDITVNPSKWDLVTNDGTAGGTKIYKEADFSTLFNLAS